MTMISQRCRTLGDLRRLTADLPDNTPISLRVCGIVDGAGSEDTFSSPAMNARVIASGDDKPPRLTLAGDGAL